MQAGVNSASGQSPPFACFKCEVWRAVLPLLTLPDTKWLLVKITPQKQALKMSLNTILVPAPQRVNHRTRFEAVAPNVLWKVHEDKVQQPK